jgi:antitoxin ParD1/3/4
MNISLTPELEKIVKEKVQSGLYNNASEVIREALRFMESSEELIYQIKLEKLRTKLAQGESDIKEGRCATLSKDDLGLYFDKLKQDSLTESNEDGQ